MGRGMLRLWGGERLEEARLPLQQERPRGLAQKAGTKGFIKLCSKFRFGRCCNPSYCFFFFARKPQSRARCKPAKRAKAAAEGRKVAMTSSGHESAS